MRPNETPTAGSAPRHAVQPAASDSAGESAPASEGATAPESLALAMTTAVVVFVAVMVVLTIPFAALSVPLPPGIAWPGLPVALTQPLLFERVWLLPAASGAAAVWAGYRAYRWSRTAR
ncbi:MAG: hypothetical protein ACE5G8_03480 [Anaerolineae bacterium]